MTLYMTFYRDQHDTADRSDDLEDDIISKKKKQPVTGTALMRRATHDPP